MRFNLPDLIIFEISEEERRIIEFIRRFKEDNKHGSIQVNFNCGGITNVNLNESVRLGK